MESQLLNGLRASIKSSLPSEVHAMVDLCIIEFVSGNYQGALAHSEHLVRNTYTQSIGWGLKALCQGKMFNYEENQHYLTSSALSLSEFLSDTSLNTTLRSTIEVLYYMTLLERTVEIVQSNVLSAEAILLEANNQRRSAATMDLAATFGVLGALNSKSSLGRTAGIAGALAATNAKMNAEEEAKLLYAVSTGSYGLAVTNLVLTLDYALRIKSGLSFIESNVQRYAIETLSNWLSACKGLYGRISNRLIGELEEALKLNVPWIAKRVLLSHEMKQFLFLSERLGINSQAEIDRLKGLIDLHSNKYKLGKGERSNDQIMVLAIGMTVPTLSGVLFALLKVSMGDILAIFLACVWVGSILYFILSKPYNSDEHKRVLSEIRNYVKGLKQLTDKKFSEQFSV